MRQRSGRRGAWGAGVLLCLLARVASADDTAYVVLLAESVQEDGVDYRAVAKGREALDAYVLRLATADPGATDPDRIAFWINAFNALALRQALDGTPGPWKVAGRDVTLDGIVETLKEFREPLVHFALHRPERSSPPLSAALYIGTGLRDALRQQAVLYLSDERFNTFDYAQLRAALSMILLRHREEFEAGRTGDVPPLQLFLADHLPKERDTDTGEVRDGAVARSLRKTPWTISFRPWDAARDGVREPAPLGPAWIAVYGLAAAALLLLGFRAFGRLLRPPAPVPPHPPGR